MNNFENDIVKFLSLNLLEKEHVYKIFLIRFEELIQILIETETLIENYLNGKPTDVFYINKEKKPEKLM